MVSLAVHSNCLAITHSNETFIIYESGEVKCLEAPSYEEALQVKKKNKTENPSLEEQSVVKSGNLCLVCCDISFCGNKLVFCSSSKFLSFWDINNFKLISNRQLIKGASQVKFTQSANYIIVADKSGDVYQFSAFDFHAPGKLIVGHMSMLLDVLVSSNEQFIITCDRDEKIRVSCFPNAYNIKSYCLGHEEFISSICFLPHDNKVLMSASGDGSVRLWDYILGNEIEKVDCCKDIENITEVLAVTGLTATINDSSSSIVCVTLNDFCGCLIYIVKQDNQKFLFDFIQIIHLEIIPWSVKLSQKKVLWILSASDKIDLQAKSWNTEINKFVDTNSKNIEHIVRTIQTFESFKNIKLSNIVATLYKRRFDNVQMYLEKKQARLLSEPSNKKIKL